MTRHTNKAIWHSRTELPNRLLLRNPALNLRAILRPESGALKTQPNYFDVAFFALHSLSHISLIIASAGLPFA